MCISGIRGSDEMRGHLAELDKAVELIESTRKSGGRVMSQCWYGRNRRWACHHSYVFSYVFLSSRCLFILYICDAYVSHTVLCRYVFCYSVLLFWWRIWWNMRGWAQLKRTISSRRLDPKQTLILTPLTLTPSIIWVAIQKMKQGRLRWGMMRIIRSVYLCVWLSHLGGIRMTTITNSSVRHRELVVYSS